MEGRLADHAVSTKLDFTTLDTRSASQINGGFDARGFAAPYASVTVARRNGTELVLRGKRLDRPELLAGEVDVWVDEARVGRFDLEGDREFEETFELPDAVLGREYVAVRFESSDYVYDGPLLDRCVAFQLTEVEVR